MHSPNPHRQCPRALASRVLALVVAVGCGGAPPSSADPQGSPEASVVATPAPVESAPEALAVNDSPAPAESLVGQVRAALPKGWFVTDSGRGELPEGWFSNDRRVLHVRGTGPGEATFRVYFVPRDWIGIRAHDPDRPRDTYWEGVLAGPGHKSITVSKSREIKEAMRELETRWSTPSLVNGGWLAAEELWRDKQPALETAVDALIKRHAGGGPAFDEAARSLIVLGVPARAVIARAARVSRGDTRDLAISALGHFDAAADPAIVEALTHAIGDAACGHPCRKYAAMSLERLGAREAGPALAAAIATRGPTDHVEFTAAVAQALARIGWTDAAPDILAAMEAEPNAHYRADYARALATLRHAPAIPAIEGLTSVRAFTAEWALGVRRRGVPSRDPGMSLLRLRGAFGPAKDGVRVALLAPASAGSSSSLALVIENQSDEMIMVPGLLAGELVVAGRPTIDLGARFAHWDGVASLHVGELWVHPLPLSTLGLSSPGRHRVVFRSNGIRSNGIELVVE